MKTNQKWFSIMVWMVLVILITLLALVILDYIVPFARNVKWIENASNAYYIAYAWVEKALYHVKTRTNLTTETWATMPTTSLWTSYITSSSGTSIPLAWQWKSEFNSGYNIISPTEPLQLEVGNGYIRSVSNTNMDFIFRVPDLDWTSTTETLSWTATTPIIYWTLGNETESLMASGSQVMANQVNVSLATTHITLSGRAGLTLVWASLTFDDFYDAYCQSSWCILKMSINNSYLETTLNNTQIPYLEYKITTTNSIPDRYTTISSAGKSHGFQKELSVSIPQKTVNQALDFTVFQ